MGRTAGDAAGDADGAPPPPDLKKALTSIFGLGCSLGGGVEVLEDVDAAAGFWDIEPLPFTCPGRGAPVLGMASTLPNVLTSLTADVGAVAGEDEMGADAAASSIEPKVTGDEAAETSVQR